LKIRWPDFTTHTRQITLSNPTDQETEINNAVSQLFDKVWKQGRPVRLIGVGVSSLGSPARQLSFWDEKGQKERRLLEAMDQLRQRYGKNPLRRFTHTEGIDDETNEI